MANTRAGDSAVVSTGAGDSGTGETGDSGMGEKGDSGIGETRVSGTARVDNSTDL